MGCRAQHKRLEGASMAQSEIEELHTRIDALEAIIESIADYVVTLERRVDTFSEQKQQVQSIQRYPRGGRHRAAILTWFAEQEDKAAYHAPSLLLSACGYDPQEEMWRSQQIAMACQGLATEGLLEMHLLPNPAYIKGVQRVFREAQQ